MGRFKSTKVYDGFSTCFRQWRANDSHCKFLHGYGVSFKVDFEGELDEKNWVFDFGGMKRSMNTINGREPKKWMDWLLDHTTIVAEDDPELETFHDLEEKGIIQLRIVPATGAERFAQYIFDTLNIFIREETGDRVRISQVEFREHGKNSAVYKEET
tara:strand:+ start:1465 stop:1935 length:471 start_codon:yes stop_codon:yes gene_type:complete